MVSIWPSDWLRLRNIVILYMNPFYLIGVKLKKCDENSLTNLKYKRKFGTFYLGWDYSNYNTDSSYVGFEISPHTSSQNSDIAFFYFYYNYCSLNEK